LRQHIELLGKGNFNSALLNLYRDGKDSVAWHSDDEPELGVQPIIASVSLGAVRKFELKNKRRSTKKFELSLAHGSLLLMSGDIQRQWLHQVPKTVGVLDPRLSITFRKVNLA